MNTTHDEDSNDIEKQQAKENHSSKKKQLTIDIAQNTPNDEDDDKEASLNSVSHSEKDPTGTMSPKSYSVFKDYLVHPAEMNLPWQTMRSVAQCSCGISFSYSVRKVC